MYAAMVKLNLAKLNRYGEARVHVSVNGKDHGTLPPNAILTVEVMMADDDDLFNTPGLDRIKDEIGEEEMELLMVQISRMVNTRLILKAISE